MPTQNDIQSYSGRANENEQEVFHVCCSSCKCLPAQILYNQSSINCCSCLKMFASCLLVMWLATTVTC